MKTEDECRAMLARVEQLDDRLRGLLQHLHSLNYAIADSRFEAMAAFVSSVQPVLHWMLETVWTPSERGELIEMTVEQWLDRCEQTLNAAWEKSPKEPYKPELCPYCGGTGKLIAKGGVVCRKCKGKGVLNKP